MTPLRSDNKWLSTWELLRLPRPKSSQARKLALTYEDVLFICQDALKWLAAGFLDILPNLLHLIPPNRELYQRGFWSQGIPCHPARQSLYIHAVQSDRPPTLLHYFSIKIYNMTEYSKIEPLFHKYNDQSSEQDDAEDSYLEEVHFRQSRISTLRWLRQEARTIILHTLFLLSNVAALMAYASGWLTPRSFPDPHDKTYEERPFALQSIYLENQTVNPAKSNQFNGPPRQDLEDAWDSLMQHQNIRVYQDELGDFATDDSVVQLSDGSGYYYSTVAVFHGLHCIQRLHNSIYPEVYYPGLTEEEAFTLRRHTVVCRVSSPRFKFENYADA
ncbi:hypothetical protein TrVFT333_011884 [Trichoderma virens FT-333]|nr:hypothetical protein TrVFT333_011884 [Trichoderma virens FT-333]